MPCKILLRYGEIALKSDFVRRCFETQFIRNIKKCLDTKRIDHNISKYGGRYILETTSLKKTCNLMENIFGMVSFSPCIETEANLDSICSVGLKFIQGKKGRSFAIKARRIGTHSYSSKDINEKLGSHIVKNTKLKVNLTKPDIRLFVEVRDKKAFLYTDIIKGPGGLPIGTQGNVIVVLENKNSVISAWIMMKRGCSILPVLKKENSILLKGLKKWNSYQDIEPRIIDSLTERKIKEIANLENINTIVLSRDKINIINKFKDFLILTPLIGMPSSVKRRILKKIDTG